MKSINSLGIDTGILLFTLACPIECDHCQYSCTASNEPEKWMSEKDIEKFSKFCKNNNVKFIRISGGEPLYNLEKFFKCVNIILRFFSPQNITIATSGYWASNEDKYNRIVNFLLEKNIKKIEVSIDRFHLKKVSLSTIEKTLKLKRKGFNIILRPYIDEKSQNLEKIILELIKKYKPEISPFYLSPIGRAEKLEKNLDFQSYRIYPRFNDMLNKIDSIKKKEMSD